MTNAQQVNAQQWYCCLLHQQQTHRCHYGKHGCSVCGCCVSFMFNDSVAQFLTNLLSLELQVLFPGVRLLLQAGTIDVNLLRPWLDHRPTKFACNISNRTEWILKSVTGVSLNWYIYWTFSAFLYWVKKRKHFRRWLSFHHEVKV